MILVAGATGQLGSTIVRKLVATGKPVRAFVRKTSHYQHLEGAELAFGDLRDSASVEAACQGVDVIIATANTAIPTQQGDNFKTVDTEGYRTLIQAAKKQGVRQFIYTSAPAHGPMDNLMPLTKAKRAVEEQLMRSGLTYTIIRSPAFMDVYFAYLGSDIPARGADNPTIYRRFGFTTMFFNSIKNNIGQKGTMMIIGKGDVCQSYICIDDVAEFHVRAIDHPQAMNQVMLIGGPEALSALDIKTLYEKVLGKTLKVSHLPARLFYFLRLLLMPFSPAIANIMALNYFNAVESTVVDSRRIAETFGVKLTRAEDFLWQHARIPA